MTLGAVTASLVPVLVGFCVCMCVCVCLGLVVTTNVTDKHVGVRFYSSAATTDNEVLPTPFYYGNLKLYPVIGS